MLQGMFGDVCEDGIDACVNMVDIIAYFTSNNYKDVCVGGSDGGGRCCHARLICVRVYSFITENFESFFLMLNARTRTTHYTVCVFFFSFIFRAQEGYRQILSYIQFIFLTK